MLLYPIARPIKRGRILLDRKWHISNEAAKAIMDDVKALEKLAEMFSSCNKK